VTLTDCGTGERTVPALALRGLTKRYDDGLLALDAVDLEVPAGGFFGLLGPKGIRTTGRPNGDIVSPTHNVAAGRRVPRHRPQAT
jgi:ABC-type branched-subunit amino acid transport system ATPase component